MGGPSYQTPYPVSDQQGGKVIWNWGTKEWTPYTAQQSQADADKAKSDEAARQRNAGGGAESDRAGTEASSTSSTGGDRGGLSQGGNAPGSPGGPGDPGGVSVSPQQLKKGTRPMARRRTSGGAMSLPGQSLLAVTE